MQADKGKTIVIINTEDYSKKIKTFLATNNFSTLETLPTDIRNFNQNNARTQNNHRQKTDKVFNAKETITTYTQSTIKIT